MADIEGRTQPSPKPWRLVVPVVALLFGILLGLAVAQGYQWLAAASAPHVAVALPQPFVLSDWEYPGAKSLTKIDGGSSEITRSGVPVAQTFAPSLYAYSTPDALEPVWSHYAKLSGFKGDFKAGQSSATTGFGAALTSKGGTTSGGGVLYFTGDPGRASVRSGTIVTQQPSYTVAVFVSRGKDEDQTHINLVVEKTPSLPPP
jgi:hypothetical protein